MESIYSLRKKQNMELNHLSDIFQSKLRLMIISSLITGAKTFRELKEITGATDGNISVQLTNLEKVAYITITKGYIGRKPQTTVELTEKGMQDFKDYVEMLKTIINKYDK